MRFVEIHPGRNNPANNRLYAGVAFKLRRNFDNFTIDLYIDGDWAG